MLRFAFQPQLEAGFSTIDIGGILSNVANKFLLDGFFSVERTWRNICAVRNVSDFKTVTSYRLIGKDQYEQVAPGGELKHGTLGEENYTNKADTYGLMLSIDRRDIINDDLGAITTVPRKLGRGSGLKINDVFWATFLDNAAFFAAGNKNYLAGADTALSIDGLTKAEVAFMDQVDSDGKPIGIMPAIVLVPTALSAMGTQLYKSMELRDTTANTKYPVANPHQGKFRVEVSRYLSNSQYTGNSQQGLVPAGRPERPAGDRGGVPQRPGVAHHRDGRRRLQRPGRADARLPRFRGQPAGPAGRRARARARREPKARKRKAETASPLRPQGETTMPTATFVQAGDQIDYTPGAAVAAGDVVVQGDLVGVAKQPIAANAPGAWP